MRIVRTFEPFPEPIFLPPDAVLRADAAMGGIQKVSRTELILLAAGGERGDSLKLRDFLIGCEYRIQRCHEGVDVFCNELPSAH